MTNTTRVRAHKRRKPGGGSVWVKHHRRHVHEKNHQRQESPANVSWPSRGDSVTETWNMTEEEYLTQKGFTLSEIDRARQTGRQSQEMGTARLEYYKEVDAAITRGDPVPQKVRQGGFIYNNPPKKKEGDYTHELIGFREGVAQVPIHYKYDKKGRKKAYRYSRMQMRWFPISVKDADLRVMTGKSYITPTMKEGVY